MPLHFTRRRCKHIAAIEHVLLITDVAPHGKPITIKKPELQCPDCKSREYIRAGPYPGKYEKRQTYQCRACGRRFRDNLGMEYRQVPHAHISLTLSGSGLSAASIQLALNDLGTKVHVDTITRILKHYVELTESYTDTFKPPCTMTAMRNSSGVQAYIMAVMDSTLHQHSIFFHVDQA